MFPTPSRFAFLLSVNSIIPDFPTLSSLFLIIFRVLLGLFWACCYTACPADEIKLQNIVLTGILPEYVCKATGLILSDFLGRVS